MTAFLVTHDHIDALLTHAIDAGASYELVPGISVPFTAGHGTMLGKVLLLANAASVRRSTGDGAIDALADCYMYRRAETVSSAQAAKLADCLDRQSSEAPTWPASLAARVVWGARPAGCWQGTTDYEAAVYAYRRPRSNA